MPELREFDGVFVTILAWRRRPLPTVEGRLAARLSRGDFVGLESEQMYPGASFDVLLSFHQEQLNRPAVSAVPFVFETAASTLNDHQGRKFRRAIEMGFARELPKDPNSRVVYTLRGAGRGSLNSFRSILSTNRRSQMAKKRAEELRTMSAMRHAAER